MEDFRRLYASRKPYALVTPKDCLLDSEANFQRVCLQFVGGLVYCTG